MGRKQRKDNSKMWSVGMSVFIAILMVLSVFGVLIGSYTNEIRYGKHKFARTDIGYETKLDGKMVQFYTLPPETFYLNFSNETRAKLFTAPFIVTTFNPNIANQSISAIELARFDLLNEIGNLKVYNAVSEYSEQYANVPLVTCENASIATPLIIFNVSDRLEVIDTGACVYFNGKANDFLKIRDLMLYAYYGVN